MTQNKLHKITQQACHAGTWLAYRLAAKRIAEYGLCDDAAELPRARVAFLASFTVEPLVDYVMVTAAQSNLLVEPYIAGFSQFNQEILNPDSGLYRLSPDITVLMVQLDAIVPIKPGDPPPADAAKHCVEQLTALAESFKNNCGGHLIVANFIEASGWPLHILADDITQAARQVNRQLNDAFANDSRVSVFDIDGLASYCGYSDATSSEMMHMAKIPYSEQFLSLLAAKLNSYFKAHYGLTKKALVLDCDNTLWGGIIGEDGIDGIKLGPDWPGSEYLDLQRAILELYNQGVILAVNSKNNHADVINVLREHRHMLLREEHFASIKCNWQPKPENMRQLAKEINIGIDSLVFIDDNPAEREMMRQMLPQVSTIEMPDNPSLFAQTLRSTSYFAQAFLTDEDRKRGQIYAAQRQRNEFQETTVSLDNFLRGLEMVIDIRPAEKTDIKRIAQMTQRTNQFNLTTRRYNEANITAMIDSGSGSGSSSGSDSWHILVLALRDKFGDNGIVGLAMTKCKKTRWQIDNFLMSCRVIGRQVEDALLDRVLTDAKTQNVESVLAEYIPTAKNALVKQFLPDHAFKRVDDADDCTLWHIELPDYQKKDFP